MKTIGNYSIECFNHGYVYLDGGSMFGAVPKALWQRKCPADEKNRIKLATRSLLLRGETHAILLDVGCGTKWSEKEQNVFAFTHEALPFKKEEITDVVITHLHFDHAGGLTELNKTALDEEEKLRLCYPNATHWIPKANLALANNPSVRERASYLQSHLAPLKDAQVELVDGSQEILPGVRTHISNGHTEGLQYLELFSKEQQIYFPSDLIPTSHHLPLPYHMGYDMCAQTVLAEKEKFLKKVMETKAVLVFQHDPEIAAATIKLNDRGQFTVDQIIEFSN